MNPSENKSSNIVPHFIFKDFYKQQKISLIDGKFDPADAKQQLLTLFSDNLYFHKIQNISNLERFGNLDSEIEAKIESLEEYRAKTEDLLNLASQHGLRVEIESDIKISITSE